MNGTVAQSSAANRIQWYKKESAKKDTRLENFDTYKHDEKEKKYNTRTLILNIEWEIE